MNDYVTIKRSDIEALFYSLTPTYGERVEVVYADDILALLDKAASVEPVGYVVSTKPELLWGGNTSSIIFREYDGHLRPLYTSPPQVAETLNPLTTTMLDYIKGEEDFDTTAL